VIAALIGLDRPRRVLGVVLKAFHFFRAKEGSRDFFQAMIREPECFGERVCRILAREHGEDYWRTLLRNGGRVWLELIEGADRPDADLYDGKLAQLTIPMCVIHGRQDPRTEPGELAVIRAQLPNASIHVLADAGHSPHSHRTAAIECNRIVAAFLHTAIEPQVLP
jgi:3-oxoadipate enol-lactonase